MSLNNPLPIHSPTVNLPRPPGPAGNLKDFQSDMLAFLEKCAGYGDVSYFQILDDHIYFINKPELIERVLLGTNDRDFSMSPGDSLSRLIFGNGLATSVGDEWKRQRKLAQPAFHSKRINAYAETMTTYAKQMLATWHFGETRDVHADMMRLTMAVLVKTLFGLDMAGQANIAIEALEVVMRELSHRFRDPLPISTPTPSNIRFLQAMEQLNEVIYAIIRERRANANDTGDLLWMLLNAQDEAGGMDDELIRDQAMTLFIAGHDTTALTPTWIFYLLAQNPEAEAKVVAELSTVLNGRAPTLDDLPQLLYTEQIIKEAMRLYPPAWCVDGRIALNDCVLDGWHVPKGAMVMMSQWVTHRDPRWYPDPARFDPDRWTDEFVKHLPKYAYFPFGGGPRVCIGNAFALMETRLILATFLQRVKPNLVPGQTVVPESSIIFTLRPKNGLQMILTAR